MRSCGTLIRVVKTPKDIEVIVGWGDGIKNGRRRPVLKGGGGKKVEEITSGLKSVGPRVRQN